MRLKIHIVFNTWFIYYFLMLFLMRINVFDKNIVKLILKVNGSYLFEESLKKFELIFHSLSNLLVLLTVITLHMTKTMAFEKNGMFAAQPHPLDRF